LAVGRSLMNSITAAQPPPTGILTIQAIDESNLHDFNRVDGTFTIDSRLVLHAQDRQIGYTIEAVPARSKRYGVDEVDPAVYIRSPDRAGYLAYSDGLFAGQILLRRNWNGYGYIEDITVDIHFRRRGIGRRLIEQAVVWAKNHALPGLMLETQDNNVAACRLYATCGFHLGGFDRELYRAIDPGTEEVALYWYLIFV
jgi:streptothricin acetyltransferase